MARGCNSAMDRLSGDCMAGSGPSPGSKLPDTSSGPRGSSGASWPRGSSGAVARPSTPPRSTSGMDMPVGGPSVSGTFGPGSGSSSGTLKMGPPKSVDTFKQQPQPPPSDAYKSWVK